MKKTILSAILCLFISSNCIGAEQKIDKVLIIKSERKIFLMVGDKKIKEYDMSLGFEPVGHKTQQGDGKTPEGIYKISGRNPKSAYHLSLRISYPNEQDKKNAQKLGVDPGGDIMIHGLPNGHGYIGKAHLLRDWTLGCIAVTSEEIKEMWDLVPNGAVVEIRP